MTKTEVDKKIQEYCEVLNNIKIDFFIFSEARPDRDQKNIFKGVQLCEQLQETLLKFKRTKKVKND